MPRIGKRTPFRVLGSAILKFAGPQVQAVATRPETPTERKRRASRVAAECERLLSNKG